VRSRVTLALVQHVFRLILVGVQPARPLGPHPTSPPTLSLQLRQIPIPPRPRALRGERDEDSSLSGSETSADTYSSPAATAARRPISSISAAVSPSGRRLAAP
jgi:hypothetical protein